MAVSWPRNRHLMAAQNPFTQLEVVDDPKAGKKMPSLAPEPDVRETLAKLKQLADERRRAAVESAARAPWYDFERVAPFRDLILVAGFVLAVAGVWTLSTPAGMIALGAGLRYGSWRMSR